MRPVILYRPYDMSEEELEAASKYFPSFRERTAIQKGDLVIGRYSVLPFYDAIQADCNYVGATLVNDIRQHRYIADLRNWAQDLEGFTPKTWYRLEDVDEPGPYVLKGKTNSRKGDWKSHMFAQDMEAAKSVYWRLCTDGLIGGESQDIYIRKFVPLKTYFKGINDIPVTKEFRFFTLYGKILSAGFYWQNYAEDMPEIPKPTKEDYKYVTNVLDYIKDYTNAVVVDIAETVEGGRIVVELNDLQMSGLSMNDPGILYAEMSKAVSEHISNLND